MDIRLESDFGQPIKVLWTKTLVEKHDNTKNNKPITLVTEFTISHYPDLQGGVFLTGRNSDLMTYCDFEGYLPDTVIPDIIDALQRYLDSR